MRFHHVALFVANVIGISVRIRHAQQITRRRADADGKNPQSFLRRMLCRFQRAVVVVLAVGEQHERLVMILFFERLERLVNRRRQRRAALWNRVHIQRLHALLERRVVNRQRTFQKRIARERHQAHAVSAGTLHQFQRGQLRPRQPVRRNVRCEHGFRRVHGDDDVQSALLHFL